NLQQINVSILGSNPLFQVEVHLSAPEIVLKPTAPEVYQLTLQNIKDCMETTKLFVRWMHGSCIECSPQYIEGDDEPIIFSFYSDISQYPQIIDQAVSTSQNLQKLLGSLSKYLNRWKKYRSLWKMDKSIVVEKFAARNPSCVSYDEKLQFYTRISEEVAEQPMMKDEQCIRLQLRPLAFSVQENANSWVHSLGYCLNESAKRELYTLRSELE
ncbi:hypothetical protein chiPu_0022938, partial [Chiloscyllium punctatum]|nr:hypothetical protein [Chiloscyllium punctatum]